MNHSSPFTPRRSWLAAVALLSVGFITESAGAQPLLISELRLRGPNGVNDEFIEIYNDSDQAVTVAAADDSAGYALVASDGVVRFTIPNGTVIPARGHFLGVNSVGYSLASYPAGIGTTATGDATYTTDIPDNAGIALFRSADPGAFDAPNRLDAVGAAALANALYKEGTGLPSLQPSSIEYAWARTFPGAALAAPGVCLARLAGAAPSDTNDNATDFDFLDANGVSAGGGQRLGPPGPQNLSSPVDGVSPSGGGGEWSAVDPNADPGAPENVARDFTSAPASNSTFGTIAIRRKFTNRTGAALTRLRFRVIDQSTFPAPGGTADLRLRTSNNVVVALTGGGTATVTGTILEQPPTQPSGGAFGSSVSVGTITPGTPLAAGASVDVQFLLGVQQQGDYRFFVVAEGLPGMTGAVWGVVGSTEGGAASFVECRRESTTTTLEVAQSGDTVTLTATVSGSLTTPEGSVTFYSDGAVIGSANVNGIGVATFSISSLTPGMHTFLANFTGNDRHGSSASGSVSLSTEGGISDGGVDGGPTDSGCACTTASATAFGAEPFLVVLAMLARRRRTRR